MDTDEKMILIRRNDFFSMLSPAEYDSLNIIHNFINTPAGQYIYFDNSHRDKLYFVKDGFVKLGIIDDAGNELIKDIIYPGDIFGRLPDAPIGRSSEFAQAYKAEVSLCAFDIREFEQVVSSSPGLALHFTRMIAGKVNKAEQRVINLLQKDVRTRLMYFLWTRIDTKKVTNNAIVIANAITHDDIARLIASSRQTVTRLFGELEKEGLIAADRKQLTILDVAALSAQANSGLY